MWYQIQIEQCAREEAEPVSDRLEETGALSVTLADNQDEPILEPKPGTTPLWSEMVIKALYSEENEARFAMRALRLAYPHLTITFESIPDKDWQQACLENFTPLRFGKRLWVCPSWTEPPKPAAVNLILDPGLAFGTGTHATTALCLTWLDQAEIANKNIIDFGCGSGILGLAAVKLGARFVQAVDIDDQALQATANNANTNHIEASHLQIGLPSILTTPVDTILANILLAPLLELKNKFLDLLSTGGVLVVTGILKEQAAQLIEAYAPNLALQQTNTLDDWTLLVFKKCKVGKA